MIRHAVPFHKHLLITDYIRFLMNTIVTYSKGQWQGLSSFVYFIVDILNEASIKNLIEKEIITQCGNQASK